MKKISLIFFLVVTAISNLIGCAQQNKDKNMTITELTEEMKSNDKLVILDVRTEGELAGPLGKIDGVINIPIQELEHRIDELEEFKDKEIAVICRTG
jgi:rhodanese-related sulfurtransferase